MPSSRLNPLTLYRARLPGASRLCVLVGLWVLSLNVLAQESQPSSSPSPDAPIELAPPPSVPSPDAPIELVQPPAPSAESMDASPVLQNAPEGQVRFGSLCLSNSDTCTDAIVLLEDVSGWWLEDQVLDTLGGDKSLPSKMIKDVLWRQIPSGEVSWQEETQKLVWSRPLESRALQPLSSTNASTPPSRSGSIPAVAIHYSASVDDRANATLANQLVFSRGDTSAFMGGVYAQGNFVRDLWRIEHDDVNHRVRYTVGEQIARPSDPLGGAARINGFGVERAYDIDPTLSTAPRPGLHGIIDQPGVVEIYNNGKLISSTPIQPGPYQWGNAPLGSGSQRIELVFRGVDGARTVLSSSFFFGSNRALNKGLTDFSLRIGQTDNSQQDNGVAWQGWARHGMTSNITVGGRAEGLGGMRNNGVDASVGVGIGALDMAYSRDNAGSDAWSANASIARKGFDIQVGRTKLDPTYWFLGREAQVFSGSSRVIDERNASVGYGSGAFSLRAAMTDRTSIDGSRTRTSTAIGTWRSKSNWRWFVTLDRVMPSVGSGQYQAALGVAIPLGKRMRNQEVEVRAMQTEQGAGGQVSWNRNRLDIYGWAANASVFRLPSGEQGAVMGYEQSTPVGSLLLSGVKTNVQQFGLASWSGSVIRADDRWFVSTPEVGPRVLVKNATTPGAMILRDNQNAGTVGPRGRLVANTPSYAATSIALDVSTLPLDADTGELQKTLITPRTGVVKVNFDTTAAGQMEGLLLIDGQPARLGVLTLDDGRQGWVGETGRLWLQGGDAGSFSGAWTDGTVEKKCTVVIDGVPPQIIKASCP